MRLLMLAEAANVHTQRWATALARRGWETTVLSISSTTIPGVTVCRLEVPPFNLRHRRRWWGRYAQFLREEMRRSRADLVHIHFLTDYPLMPPAPDDPPLVVSTWGSDVVAYAGDPPDSPEKRDRKVALLRGAAALTATTRFLAERTACYGGINEDGITVIPFGVDCRRFDVDRPSSATDTPVVGFIKHLESRYGIQHLIEAIPAVLAHFAAARFRIIGDGPLGEALIQQADRLGVGEAIDWVGRIPNERVPTALAEMDVFVMPSLADAFGVAAVEAQAAGVPVVFSALPGVAEAVTDGVGGLAVPPGEPAALADAICRLLADEDLRQRLGGGGRQMVRRRFEFEDNVTRMEQVYQRVVAERLCNAR
ncbi:MAG: glycosyltransferase family 4 protein [bacterium]|nr:glycosyltransferase family 4 protein [bacterium]